VTLARIPSLTTSVPSPTLRNQMLKFRQFLPKWGAAAGLLALVLCPFWVQAEITVAADFPLPRGKKADKAAPQSQLLELYRQDVLATPGLVKAKTAAAPSTSVTR
jgi:hypothetical protein